MNRLAVLLALIATPAIAEQQPESETMQRILGAIQNQRNAAQDQAAVAQAEAARLAGEVSKLKADIEALKNPAPEKK